MKIINIVAREILNSLGKPTISCDVILQDGTIFNSSVPSRQSKGKHEAFELRDNKKRLEGKGVLTAVDLINNEIAPQFLGKEPNAIQMDLDMIQMDGTTNKSKLGANSLLALSMAIYRAHAYISEMELFDFLALVSGSDTVSLPIPMINFVDGGLHADNNLLIQEYQVIPFGAQNLKSAVEQSLEVFLNLEKLLKSHERQIIYGDEGGFGSYFETLTEPLDFIQEAIKNSGFDQDIFSLGIDVAACQFYDPKTKFYNLYDNFKTAQEMIDIYKNLVEKYNLHSIEDGLGEDDWSNWEILTQDLGNNVHIIGDDLFATNPERIAKGIELGAANTAIIKPNQIGTITETLQSIQLCKDYGLSTIISHCSGETNDTFIADLSVGSSSNYIKCGGLTRGERVAKYNRLLEIENLLTNMIISE